MSFKRDGDNRCLLANLKHQRVGDLLVSHIPSDEAVLLKNGRYSCTVCFHNPIFDTLQMLALHRKGKKHLFCLSKRLEQKQQFIERKNEFQKEVSSLKSAVPSKSSQKASFHPLLKAKPYSSCGRKRKITLQKAAKVTLPPPKPVNFENNSTSVLKMYVENIQKKKAFNQVVEKAKSTLPNFSAVVITDETSNSKIKKQDSMQVKSLTENERQKASYYLNLRMSGWKKDWTSGTWVRDQEAEFDSDDEEPHDYEHKNADS